MQWAVWAVWAVWAAWAAWAVRVVRAVYWTRSSVLSAKHDAYTYAHG